MSENNGHDDRARRAIEMFIRRYGAAEALRRMLACADSTPLPFDLDGACELVEIQCGRGCEREDDDEQ